MRNYKFQSARFEFNPRDLFVGIYFKRQRPCLKHYRDDRTVIVPAGLHFYLCVIPCFPLHISFLRKEQKNVRHSVHFETAETH